MIVILEGADVVALHMMQTRLAGQSNLTYDA
jgi:hypothetical protein